MFPLVKYKGLIILGGVLVIGFVLLCGTANESTTLFNTAIFSFRRITLAPWLIVCSYIGLIWLILHQPSK